MRMARNGRIITKLPSNMQVGATMMRIIRKHVAAGWSNLSGPVAGTCSQTMILHIDRDTFSPTHATVLHQKSHSFVKRRTKSCLRDMPVSFRLWTRVLALVQFRDRHTLPELGNLFTLHRRMVLHSRRTREDCISS